MSKFRKKYYLKLKQLLCITNDFFPNFNLNDLNVNNWIVENKFHFYYEGEERITFLWSYKL
jgi:hypothetical protein